MQGTQRSKGSMLSFPVAAAFTDADGGEWEGRPAPGPQPHHLGRALHPSAHLASAMGWHQLSQAAGPEIQWPAFLLFEKNVSFLKLWS